MREQTFGQQGIESYPLCWPAGWKRTNEKTKSRFVTTFDKSRRFLFEELRRLGCEDYNAVLSTNIPLRKDGMPYATHSPPRDPGVAIYFRIKGRPMVIACDQYLSVTENLYAIAKTIEALRGIERWGASEMLERSFTGFAALPAPENSQSWFEVLGVPEKSTRDVVKSAWLRLAKLHHPDNGGSNEMMSRLNAAYSEGMRQ